jgi:hypothetical protein
VLGSQTFLSNYLCQLLVSTLSPDLGLPVTGVLVCLCPVYIYVRCNVAMGLSLLEGKGQETQNLWYEPQLH